MQPDWLCIVLVIVSLCICSYDKSYKKKIPMNSGLEIIKSICVHIEAKTCYNEQRCKSFEQFKYESIKIYTEQHVKK